MWRTGHHTRTKAVAKAHGLRKRERLLGWLYVGGKPERPHRKAEGAPKLIDAESFVSVLER